MKIYNIDFSVNLLRSILWQYNDAENLQALINAEAQFYNVSVVDFWQSWFNDVFNLNTANDFGMVVWAIILGVSQEVRLEESAQSQIWGFNVKNEGGDLQNSYKNFSGANFASYGSILSVSAEQLRILLKIRAMQLVSNGSAYDINRMLNVVFSNNTVIARDNYDMTITYVFSEPPPNDVIFLLQRSEAFRPPAAVGYKVQIFSSNTWGFGQYRMNFYRGNFYNLQMSF